MKKISAVIIIFSLLFALSSCKKAVVEEATTCLDETCFEQESEAQSVLETTTQLTEPSANEATTAVSTTQAQAAETKTQAQTAEITTIKKPSTTEKIADSVSFSIFCTDILDNAEDLKPGKEYFVPSDGVILNCESVEIIDGETVFDVLKRVCAENDIQLEYAYSGAFGTYYIEGINQIYEKDCGMFSGWKYTVNGYEPNVGCSAYKLKNGDTVKFVFSCDL